MIERVDEVVVEPEDRDRALELWTKMVGYELARDASYGEGQRWLEVATRDEAVVLALSRRLAAARQQARRSRRPTSACGPATARERARS